MVAAGRGAQQGVEGGGGGVLGVQTGWWPARRICNFASLSPAGISVQSQL